MGKSRKDYEKFLNSISPDRDDEAWIIGGKNRYCGRENYGTMIKRYDPIGFNVGYRERSYRYKGYGYNMCRETKKKLLQAIKGVNVEEEDVSLYTTGGWD